MYQFLDEEMKGITILNERLSLASSCKPSQEDELNNLADSIAANMRES